MIKSGTMFELDVAKASANSFKFGWLLGLMIAAEGAAATELSPQDFAFGLPVITTKDAAAYRFTLPLDVYRGTAREDLADIRLFNAQAEAVPFSLLRPAASPQAAVVPIALPMLAGANPAVNQYILDGRGLNAAVAALQLNWPESATDYSGRVKIEASDDLQSWKTVVTAAPTANLHANGQLLVENRISLAPTLAKFWRISWVGPPPRFELTSVLAAPADRLAESAHSSLDIDGSSSAADADADVFDLGAHLPVSRVNVLLPETNTVDTIEVSSRRAAVDTWRTVAQSGFYRLKTTEGEQQNASIDILVNRNRYWRVRILSGGGLPRMPLRLHVEWVPNEVTFLARGQPPFQLAYGNAAITGAETDLGQIPSDVDIASADVGPMRVLGGAGRLEPKAPPNSRIRFALGTLVIIGIVLFTGAAVRLSRRA